MNLYRVDVPVWATAYIKAESEEAAAAILKGQIAHETLEVPTRGNEPFDGRSFEALLEDQGYSWSLSPAMTVADWEFMKDDLSFEEVEE
jgi:hypothetical protein